MSKQDYYAQVTKTNLERISNWATQWKMNFNLDTTKQAQEVIFSRKVKKNQFILHTIYASVARTSSQKHLGIILDNRLKFDDHMKMVLRKISKTIGLLRKLHNFLPSAALIELIPEKASTYVTRNAENIPLVNIKHNFYKNLLFPSSIIEWNNLDPKHTPS